MKALLRLLLFSLGLAPSCVWADAGMGFMYNRSTIVIMRAHVPQTALPWQVSAAPDPAVPFDLEVRDGGNFTRQAGWFNLSSPGDRQGVLVVFATAGMQPVIHSPEYAPLDILLIDSEGKIMQLLPDVILNELTQDITPPAPVKAYLFLKGGICGTLFIRPGDVLMSDLFKKSPVLINPDSYRRTRPVVVSRPPPALAMPDMKPARAQ